MTSINFIDGEKGGVGKSWVCRTMIQYFIDRKIPYVAFEADRSNPTVRNIYSDTRTAFFSEVEMLSDVPDRIFDSALEKSVIVNLPAQVHRAVSMWIDSKGVLNYCTENNIDVYKWWVCDGEQDSIELFIKSLDYYQGEIPHILIRNEGRCQDWQYIDDHKLLNKAITDYSVKVIGFPRLYDNKRILVNANNLTFEAAAKYEPFGILGQNQIRTYLRDAYKQFDSTDLFPVQPIPAKV